ncbi:MAG: hypothetical protein ACYDEN_07500 [Acidimicrobiales bacterium]
MTVLVVDDERDLCEPVRINLELDGHAVLAAPTLPAAAASLGVSRSYLYACFRRMARQLGSPSGPQLLRTRRADGRT